MSVSPAACACRTHAKGLHPQHLTQSEHPTAVEPRPEARSTDSHMPQLEQRQTGIVQSRGNSKALGPSYNLGVKRAGIAGPSQLLFIYGFLEGRDTPYFFCQPLATLCLGVCRGRTWKALKQHTFASLSEPSSRRTLREVPNWCSVFAPCLVPKVCWALS